MTEKKLLLLDPDPTFEVQDIEIPRAGKEPMRIDVVFRFMAVDEYLKTAREMADRPLVDLLEVLIHSWGESVSPPYSPDVLSQLCRSYPKAGRALLRAYERELYEVEEKN